MDIEKYKEACYIASQHSSEHWYQTRSWFDRERQMHIQESPDIPGCYVELPEPLDDPESDDFTSVDDDLLDRMHWEKKVELLYGYLERGEPLPKYSQRVKNEEAIARAKAQSPFYFIIKVEWHEAGSPDQNGEVEELAYWLATSELPMDGVSDSIYDYEDEIGRVLAMIGDNFWAHLDMYMEDDRWPPERKSGDVTIRYFDHEGREGSVGADGVISGFFDGS